MNKMTIAAIAVAAVLLVAGAYVVMSMGNNNNNDNNPDDGDDGTNDGDNNTQTDAVDSQNKTLAVSFPTTVTSGDRKMALMMTYPGKGNESSYTYNWSEYYQFNLTATPASGYTGNVLIKMFAEKSKEIGGEALIVKDFQDNQVIWTFAKKNNSDSLQNVISGDIVSWKTDGTPSERSVDVMFKGTGNYTLTIQAFDLDTGKAISDPLKMSPMYVPVKGNLTIVAVIHGQYIPTSNGTYYVTLVNVTNDWNVQYHVDPANFYMSNATDEVAANLTAMSFTGQDLQPGQTTQFQVYFDITGVRTTFSLRYDDPVSGNIPVVLPTPVDS